jgi:hypothetical protein
MSQDRRPLTETEQIGVFEHYLKRYCEENHTDKVVITDKDGKPIFEAKLLIKPDNKSLTYSHP